MCIISGPVKSVNSTKILVLPSRNGTRQLTVYSNVVATPNSNAMCLPVPNPSSVKFERVPKDIFTQCANSFIINNGASKRGSLPIISHGSYDVILVPSMNDIERIPRHFTILTKDVVEFLRASYPENFGIVLCKLKNGAQEYEPFAYSHNLLPNGQLFFPTKHYHSHVDSNVLNQQQDEDDDDDSGWAASFGQTMLGKAFTLPGKTMPKVVNNRIADDWDHEIYTVCTPIWCHDSKKKVMSGGNQIKWNLMPYEFQLSPNLPLRCKEIVGQATNVDIEMPVKVY